MATVKTPHDDWPWWLTLLLSPLAVCQWLHGRLMAAFGCLLLGLSVLTVVRRILGTTEFPPWIPTGCCGDSSAALTDFWAIALGGGTALQRQTFYLTSIPGVIALMVFPCVAYVALWMLVKASEE